MLWAIFDGETLIAQVEAVSPEASGVDLTGRSAVQIARRIDDRFETIDPATGAITSDPEAYDAIGAALIDRAYEAGLAMPAPAKAAEHGRKLAEALIVADGGDAGPLLSSEAAATGQAAASLADAVIAKNAADRIALDAAAVARREAITAMRAAETVAAKALIVTTYVEDQTA